MVNYTLAAHPTIYSKIRFRSRLEARWAVFFTRCGWKWSYEPIDLLGWSPDFMIKGKPVEILVEVKPITDYDVDTGERMANSVKRMAKKPELLLLGLEPIWAGYDWGSPAVGWLIGNGWDVDGGADLCVDRGQQEFSEAPLGFWKPERVGFCHGSGLWDDRISGIHDPHFAKIDREAAEMLWARAGNAVQWKAPQ